MLRPTSWVVFRSSCALRLVLLFLIDYAAVQSSISFVAVLFFADAIGGIRGLRRYRRK